MGQQGRIGAELQQVGGQLHQLEQLGNSLAVERRDLGRHDVAAPILDLNAGLGQLLLHAIDIGVVLVDLVDRDDQWDVGRLGVVDCLLGLRHDSVVGRDHQDDDVRRPGAARAHQGERLVTRGVEEHDLAVVGLDLVGADVLGDAAVLALGDLGRADVIEQRRLAVIDMAHDGDDGAARDLLPLALVALHGVLDLHLFLEGDHARLHAEVGGNLDRQVGIEHLVDGRHRAPLEERLLQILGLDAELLRIVADGHPLGYRDDAVRSALLERQAGHLLRLLLALGAPLAPGRRVELLLGRGFGGRRRRGRRLGLFDGRRRLGRSRGRGSRRGRRLGSCRFRLRGRRSGLRLLGLGDRDRLDPRLHLLDHRSAAERPAR